MEIAKLLWFCLIAFLASGSAIDALQHGSVFASLRASMESLLALAEYKLRSLDRLTIRANRRPWVWYCWKLRALVLELASCVYCQTYHWPWVFLIWMLLADGTIMQVPVLSLATTRILFLTNRLLPDCVRFERPLD